LLYLLLEYSFLFSPLSFRTDLIHLVPLIRLMHNAPQSERIN